MELKHLHCPHPNCCWMWQRKPVTNRHGKSTTAEEYLRRHEEVVHASIAPRDEKEGVGIEPETTTGN